MVSDVVQVSIFIPANTPVIVDMSRDLYLELEGWPKLVGDLRLNGRYRILWARDDLQLEFNEIRQAEDDPNGK